jgi:hypothetical protein
MSSKLMSEIESLILEEPVVVNAASVRMKRVLNLLEPYKDGLPLQEIIKLYHASYGEFLHPPVLTILKQKGLLKHKNNRWSKA